MNPLHLTRHAQVRSQQRALSVADIDLVWELGTVTGPNRIAMTNADVDREIGLHKAEISRLERLRGVHVVSNGATVITTFHASRPKARRNHRLSWKEQ